MRELNKLEIDDINEILEKYGFIKIHDWSSHKSTLIDGIITYEKMSLGGKQTEIKVKIDNKIKSYFLKTKSGLLLVKKVNIINLKNNTKNNVGDNVKSNVKNNVEDNVNTYGVYECPYKSNILSTFTFGFKKQNMNDKTCFRFRNCSCKSLQKLLDDLEICHKAIQFI